MKKAYLLSMILILVIGCSTPSIDKLDILPTQFIFSGDTSRIVTQDLFYAQDYSTLSLREHPHLNTTISHDASEIKIYAERDYSGFTSLTMEYNGHPYDIPIKVIDRKYITFHYTPSKDENVQNVCVFGNFNFWLRDQLMMKKSEDASFSITIPFEPGQYEYLFGVDGKEILDPSNPKSVPNGLGGYNSPLKVIPTFSGKKPFITPLSIENDKSLVLRFKIIPNDYQGDFSPYNIIALLDNKRIISSQITIHENILSITIPQRDAIDSRRLRLAWSNEITTSNLAEVILENGVPAGNNGAFKWQDAIIYSLMVDRFKNGNRSNDAPIMNAKLADRANFNGGDLQGLIEKLDDGYFNALGVNTLWILPIVKNTDKAFLETPPPHRMFSGYHGYWPVSGREVDPHYGNNDDVHTMVEVAHEHKIRLLMDFISNHVHQDHPYYQKHPEWFGQYELEDGRKNLRLFDEYRLTTWFESYLPSFDYPNAPEAIDTMVADAIWWLKNYKIDGFRHDAVKHVPNIFWRALTQQIRKEFPDQDVFQIGETFGDHSLIHSYVNNGQLSAQFNFNLYWPARYAFAMDNESFSGLAEEMERVIDIYGQNHLMANVMDSHDQPRYPAYLEHDLDWGDNAQEVGWHKDIQIDDPLTYQKISMYMSYLMTIPGPPVIYYGNEIGMTGAADPDNRRPMQWEIDPYQKELKTYVSTLTSLRKKHSALRYGDYLTVRADKAVYSYLRSDFNERILVVIFRKNFNEEIHLTLPPELDIQELECLNKSVEFRQDPDNSNVFHIQAKPYSAYIFKVTS